MDRFIFSKKYDANQDDLKDIPVPKLDDFDTFMKKLKESTAEEIPERKEKAELFVNMIMEFCDFFEHDVEITKNQHDIEAKLSIECLVLSRHCKNDFCRILELADEIDIHTDRSNNHVMCLRYYTHEVYFDGRKTRYIK